YFTRGSGHNAEAQYTERPEEWRANLARLHKKFEHARTLVPKPGVGEGAGAEIGIISYGSNESPIAAAPSILGSHGVKTSYLRLRALPTTDEYRRFVTKHPRLYVVENNFDAQMAKILQTEAPAYADHLKSVNQCDGLPLTGRWIAQSILDQER